MNLYEAIFVRKSVRDYTMEALDESTLKHIQSFIAQLKPYKSSIGYDIQIVDNTNDNNEVKGLFHVKAPYYLVISSEPKQDYLINAGYLIHQMVLYLTAKNIGTCYQGGIRPKGNLKNRLKYDFVIAVAFGKSPKNIYRPYDKAKRLDEESLVVYKEEVSESVKTILRAAILSPSSLNNQPWRFVVYHNRIHVFCKKARFFNNVLSDSKLIDMGIALDTITEAADELWMESSIIKSETVKSKDLKNTEYITSVILKDKVF